jgi:hypothetical protein
MNNATRPTCTVTLNVTGYWQPTLNVTGKTAEFTAVECFYVVDDFTCVTDHDCRCVTFTGTWETEEQAKRYARSCGDARVRRVNAYWYVPHFGPVKPGKPGQVAA